MPDATPQRRLAAIVSTDVVGYSRLMEADEADTLARMKGYRQELWGPLIERHGGRIVGTAGDALLVEYSSAVSAVESAIAVQEEMAAREAAEPDERKMLLRVGVNIGEVVVDGDDIYGDGVNVAARLQALAPPGGVCISGKVHDEIEGKLAAAFADAGEQQVKNIARPVRVWQWSTAEPVADADAPAGPNAGRPLPDKPSIAVLPFDNMSVDPEQEFFADGITEDVITELSHFRALHVIARNSTFTYKGQSVNVQQVSRDLGVRYVVEGSVRMATNRVRVTAQLIDAVSGSHLWADRYDRDLTDIFAVQDEITHSVVRAIAPEVLVAEDASARRKPPDSLSAWECVVRGNARMWNITREDFAAAAALYDQAVRLDPDYAAAHSAKAFLTVWNAFQGWGGRIVDDLAQALASAKRALALDASDAMAHYAAGFVNMMGRRPDRAIDEQRTAIALNPNSADAHFGLGMALCYAGRVEAALEALDMARQLNPRGPTGPVQTAFEALAHFCAGQDEDAARLAARSIEERPDFAVSLTVGAAALGHLGRLDEARDLAANVMRMYPTFSLARHERAVPIAPAEDRARYLDGLRKAGLPD